MKAGRELDQLVAEKVMGWERISDQHAEIENAGGLWKTPAGPRVLLPFSADIARAWEVVERMTEPDRSDMCTFNMRRITDWDDPTWGYDVLFGERGNPTYQRERCVWAPTAPLAICLAALRALGVDTSLDRW